METEKLFQITVCNRFISTLLFSLFFQKFPGVTLVVCTQMLSRSHSLVGVSHCQCFYCLIAHIFIVDLFHFSTTDNFYYSTLIFLMFAHLLILHYLQLLLSFLAAYFITSNFFSFTAYIFHPCNVHACHFTDHRFLSSTAPRLHLIHSSFLSYHCAQLCYFAYLIRIFFAHIGVASTTFRSKATWLPNSHTNPISLVPLNHLVPFQPRAMRDVCLRSERCRRGKDFQP